MKVTLSFPDDLLQRAKDEARKRGLTLREIVILGIEKSLREEKPGEPKAPDSVAELEVERQA